MKILIKKAENLFVRQAGCSGGSATVRRAAVGGLAVVLSATALIGLWIGQRAPAMAAAEPDEVDLAIAATLEEVLSEPNYPKDMDTLNRVVWVRFSARYPDLAVRELRQDPAYVEAEEAAFATISNPAQVYEELMKDEDYRRQSEEGMRALTQGVGEGNAKLLEHLAQTLPSLEEAARADAALRKNPEWRRQRREFAPHRNQ